jgi:hypothetical protein
MTDINKVVEEVLALAREQAVFTDDLAASEEKLLELMRQLGQAVQQLHMNQQSGLGYDTSSRPCTCGDEQKFVGHRAKTFQTLFGSLELQRAYYHCRHCHRGCTPYDQAQGLGSRGVSVPLAKRVVELTQDVPFGKSQRKLKSLLGCVLSENTLRRITQEVGQKADQLEQQAADQMRQDRQALPQLEQGRLYVEADGAMVHFTDGWHEVKNLVCRWQDAREQWRQRVLCRREKVEAFTAMAWATAHGCGLENARQSVLLGDGIAWIWNHLGSIADEAVQILDWYHASEHLWATGKALHGEGTDACRQFSKSLETLLWESRTDELFQSLDQLCKPLRSRAKREAVKSLRDYLYSHRGRIDYQAYRDQGLYIGSGAVEGMAKNHVHARMKIGSPRWSQQGCQSMLSLRSAYANDQQETLWNHKPLLAA